MRRCLSDRAHHHQQPDPGRHAIESLTGINVAQVITYALDSANPTGMDGARAIQACEPDPRAEVDVDLTANETAEGTPLDDEQPTA